MDNREAVRDILQEVSMQERQEGKYYCGLDEKYVDQICSLWPKVLSEEKRCEIAKPTSATLCDELCCSACDRLTEAISQATIDKE